MALRYRLIDAARSGIDHGRAISVLGLNYPFRLDKIPIWDISSYRIAAEAPMLTELRPISINPVWKSILRQSGCAGHQHLSGELSLQADSLHRGILSDRILPISCIFPVIKR